MGSASRFRSLELWHSASVQPSLLLSFIRIILSTTEFNFHAKKAFYLARVPQAIYSIGGNHIAGLALPGRAAAD